MTLIRECEAAGCVLATTANRLTVRGPRKAGAMVRRILDRGPDVARMVAVREAVRGKIDPDPIVPVRLFDPRDLDGNADDTRIPEGWDRRGWVERLRVLSRGCEATHADRAVELRRRAEEIEAR